MQPNLMNGCFSVSITWRERIGRLYSIKATKHVNYGNSNTHQTVSITCKRDEDALIMMGNQSQRMMVRGGVQNHSQNTQQTSVPHTRSDALEQSKSKFNQIVPPCMRRKDDLIVARNNYRVV